MENRKEIDMEKLIDEFDEEKEFCKSVFDQFYAFAAALFKDEVEDGCKVVIFGDEYALSVQELYSYDSYLAVELWRHHVDRLLEEEFHSWVEQFIWVDIETFSVEFQQWLSERNDERASNAIVALMTGDINLNKIIVDWLCGCLCYKDWKYPA